jgi:hypothetical protein
MQRGQLVVEHLDVDGRAGVVLAGGRDQVPYRQVSLPGERSTAERNVFGAGAENVTTMAGMAAGTATGTLTILGTSADWTSYGKVQDGFMADPEAQALLADPNSPVASWDAYVFQTIPDL